MKILATLPTGAPGRLRHLVVQAPDRARVGDLRERLAAEGHDERPVDLGPAPADAPLLHGCSIGTSCEETVAPVASVLVMAGPDSGRGAPLHPGRWLTIGRDPGCDLTIEDPGLSRRHLRVRQERDQIRVEDLGSTNGVTWHSGSGPFWTPGTTLLAGSSRLLLVAGSEPPLVTSPFDGRHLVRPWPRVLPEPPAVELVTPAPSARRTVRPPSVWSWSLPLLVSGLVALALRMPWLLLFGVLGPAMVLGQWLGDRRTARVEYEEALVARGTALARLEEDRAEVLRTELAQRRARDPGVMGARTRVLPHPSVDLWSSVGAPWRVVLGEGQVTSLVTLDGMSQTLGDAPITLELEPGRPIAIVGRKPWREALARSLVLQLATAHPPADLTFRVDPDHPPAGWDLLAWLPHTQSSPADGQRSIRWGHDLLLLDNRREVPPGVTCVVLESPAVGCLQVPGEPDVRFRPTLLAAPLARALARRLAPLTDGTQRQASAATTLGTLLDWPTDRSEAGRLWATDRVCLRVPVGTGPEGVPVELDLAIDGPHALVAGTTGSGKSELLRTWVTALAIRNPPDRLSFLLIDYKGGSSLAECAGLPHATGLVTDLDPQLAERVLVSLQAELKRREAVLARAGARDVKDYDGPDLPRLVIVIDEFRVLREELPAFLDGLIRVAAVGRSLGLHLVLATQRPAGVITPDLRANVNLRIALRLRDEADSRDVIESSAAALIPEGCPGAALLRTGSGAPRTIQVAPAAARPEASQDDWDIVEVSDLWSGFAALRAGAAAPPASSLGGLPALLSEEARRRGMSSRPVWIPPLPEHVGGSEVPSGTWALADHPESQSRSPLRWEPGRTGSIGVLGSGRSGRSAALASLVHSAAPTWLYVLDPGRGLQDSWLKIHPGLRAWVGPDDRAHGIRTLEVLGEELDRRRLDPERAAEQVVIVLDGWDRWLEAYGELEAGRGVDLALRLLREGRSAGLHLAISGDRSLLIGKVAAALPETWALRLHDPGELSLSGLRREQIPQSPPPGRAVRLSDGLLAQVVVTGRDILPADLAAPADHANPGPSPTETLTDPEQVTSLRSSAPPQVVALPTECRAEGWAVGGDDAAPIPLPRGSMLVLGPPRSGVSSTLHRLLDQDGAEAGPRVVTIPDPSTWDEGELARALAADPHTVLVDQAHLLAGTTTEDLVLDWSRRTRGRLLVGGDLEACSNQFRGLAAHLATGRRGVILGAHSGRDGHVLGVTLPVGDPQVPGRGLLVDRGQITRIQVSRPRAAP